PRFVQLMRLNKSALNSHPPHSWGDVTIFFNTEKSFWRLPGPTILFLPVVPNRPAAGCENAAVLKYSDSCALRERLNDRLGSPVTFGLCERLSTREGPSNALSCPENMFTGVPPL